MNVRVPLHFFGYILRSDIAGLHGIPGQREMQIKTTLRFHLNAVRMAIIKNTEDWGQRNPHSLLVVM
jgi:hypothetical protein